jgi:hypothetical protein
LEGPGVVFVGEERFEGEFEGGKLKGSASDAVEKTIAEIANISEETKEENNAEEEGEEMSEKELFELLQNISNLSEQLNLNE